ncbi:GNAT family N-acetyltransferase [Bacillus siamensis]|uniref:GNAT family N-acetyltransferase n=1 Tax=Bacillus siamensis TaxID=659243 RepID=UPI0022B7D58E|nr:GNAT family N-acetyltransferase [Bacillus siamensis]
MYIRRLTASDTQLYSSIRLKALKDHPDAFAVSYDEEKEWPPEKFKARLEADNAIVLGAIEKGSLIGIIKISNHPLYKLRHIPVIGSMYVSPKHRGSGAGKALMTEAISQAKKMKDTEQLHLSVTSTNEPAKKLYTQLGFILFSTEKRALKLDHQQYVDVDHMVLYLS